MTPPSRAKPSLDKPSAPPKAGGRRVVIEPIEPRLLMATIAVTSTADAGPGSLRAAMAASAANDTIDLTALVGTITVADPLPVFRNLSFVGPGPDKLTISGDDRTSGFVNASGAAIAISGLTLSHFTNTGGLNGAGALSAYGTAGASFLLDRVDFVQNKLTTTDRNFRYAPAISMDVAGTVAMVDCNVVDNVGGGYGGGVYTVNSRFTALRCTFARNRVTLGGGGGGLLLLNNTQDRLTNCTIAENVVAGSSDARGVGMFVLSNGPLTMTHCTVVNNTAPASVYSIDGGGLYYAISNSTPARAARITNTIFAGNTNGQYGDVRIGYGDPYFYVTHSLIGDGTGSGVYATDGNRIGTHNSPIDARVGRVGDYGGDTLTVPLRTGSPAIDAAATGDATVPVADQRNVARLNAPDVGAFEAVPAAPAFAVTPPARVTAGQSYAGQIAAIDANGDAVSFTLANGPAWLTLADRGDGTAVLTGTPPVAGEVSVELTAGDGTLVTTFAFTLTVERQNNAPAFTTAALPPAVVGIAYDRTVHAVDPEGDPIAFTTTSKPAWMTVTDNGDGTATLGGTPAVAGTASLTLTVDDGTLIASRTYALTVDRGNAPPTFTNGPLPPATTGVAYRGTVRASDADGDAIAITAISKPAWMTVTDNGDGTATLGGTPTAADVGTGDVTLHASDGRGGNPWTYAITVTRSNATPTFADVPALSALSGRAFSYVVRTADADGDPRTITLGDAPAWLTLADRGDGTAELRGTPADADRGVANAFVTVSDGVRTSQRRFEIAVVASPSPSPVRIDANGTLRVAGSAEADRVVVWHRGDVVRVIYDDRVFNFAAGDVRAVAFEGGDGDDVLSTNVASRPVFADGGGGHDTLIGSAGDDTLRGGDGDDLINGSAGDDAVYGDAGNDRLAGGDDADGLFGGDGRDRLDGGAGRDWLRGEAGRDVLTARDGFADRLIGGDVDEDDRASADRRDVVVRASVIG